MAWAAAISEAPREVLYGSWFSDLAYLDGALSYSRQSFENTRHIRVGELVRTANSDHDGDLFAAYAETGINLSAHDWMLQPFAGLLYSHLREEGYRETGAEELNLRIARRASNSLISDLGLRVARPFASSNWLLIPEAQIAWRHDFDIDDRQTTAAFVSTPAVTFKSDSRNGARNSAVVGAGITLITTPGISLNVNYKAELRSKYDAQKLSAGIRFEF